MNPHELLQKATCQQIEKHSKNETIFGHTQFMITES